ncbi:unnamed protein product [Oikopleura dioica]|uniref:ShKT domain-containing protein n=1 Tax=Oikopleura dioica TaxID=34765 RepID=E4X1P0_OIKDI|nr:unnamed protein product [Oikopleura dioica]
MAFKFALIAAAAASRIARQADSENEKLIKECQDTRPWLSCIQAYSNGECSGLGGGCDRTCGLCKTDACYDRIPMPHVKMFEDGVPARAMWPTLSNRAGENSFPRRNTTEMAEFPWENSSFSSFCLNVFKNGLCGSYDSLSITYDHETAIFLSGQPSEYCAFTCGVCKQTSEEPTIKSCFTDHNNIMFALASENSGPAPLTFTEMPDEGSEATTEGYEVNESPEGTEAPETGVEYTTIPWWEQFSFRKRRSQLAIEKRDVIVSAIESILSSEHARERRSLFDFAFEDFGDFFESVPEQFTDLARDLVSCNNMLVKNLDNVEAGEDYVEEPSEATEGNDSPIIDIVHRREQKDFAGIQKYFNANSEYLTVNIGQCKWVEITVDEEIEDLAGIELTYDCPISCPAGYALEIEGESSKQEKIRVNCNKENQRSTNMLRDSICESAMYCPNHLCQTIACVESEAEESSEESFSEFDW